MRDVDVKFFLQSLQGKQSTIVLAYLIVRRAMTLDELGGYTGLNGDTVRSAVRGLEAKGLLFVQRGERGRQVWHPSGDTFFAGLFGQNPKISDSSSSSSSAEAESSYLEEEEEEGSESEKIRFCLSACDEYGIREPKRGKLSRLRHVTPEFIKAHVLQARAEGLPIGSAIYRIEYDWAPAEKYLRERVDMRGCWDKFVGGGDESEDE